MEWNSKAYILAKVDGGGCSGRSARPNREVSANIDVRVGERMWTGEDEDHVRIRKNLAARQALVSEFPTISTDSRVMSFSTLRFDGSSRDVAWFEVAFIISGLFISPKSQRIVDRIDGICTYLFTPW